jgi:hypothetical protein
MLAFPLMTALTLLLEQMLSLSSFSGFRMAPYYKTFLSAPAVYP